MATDKTRNILLIGPHPLNGEYVDGPTVYVGNLSEQLAKNMDVTVVSHSINTKEKVVQKGKLKIILLKKKKSRLLARLLKGIALARKHDIIHINEVNLFILKYFTRSPLVITIHGHSALEGIVSGNYKKGSFKHNFYCWIERKAATKADAIIVVSKNLKHRLIVDTKVNENKITYIPNGIDYGKFQIMADSQRKNMSETKPNVRNPILLFVKGISEINGIRNVITSMPLVISKHPNVRLFILGDGPLKDEMIQLVNTLKLNKYVQFFGQIEHNEVIKYLCMADIFCGPTGPVPDDGCVGVGDNLGFSHLEAMACGLPTIAAKGGLKSGQFHEELNSSIIVVPYGDPEGLSNAINYLLDNDDIRKKIGINGKEYVNRCTLEENAKNVKQIYETIMKIRDGSR